MFQNGHYPTHQINISYSALFSKVAVCVNSPHEMFLKCLILKNLFLSRVNQNKAVQDLLISCSTALHAWEPP